MRRALTLLLVTLIGCAPTPSSPATSTAGDKKAASDDGTAKAQVSNPALLDPFAATETAPAVFRAKFETTKGDFVIETTRAWAPLGADRFYNLVKLGYFDDVAFFRAIEGFMVQFGLHGIPEVTSAWRTAPIKDDPVKQSNKKGMVSFATSGPDTRTTQIFINYNDNVPLDGMGFSPFGKVVEGMEVVESLHKGYGEGAPKGSGPGQPQIEREGNAYLKKRFPKLDYVKRATIVE